MNTILYRFYFLIGHKQSQWKSHTNFLCFSRAHATISPKNGWQEPMKNASVELWCSIRCKQNLHSIDLMILTKIRIVKNFESVKSYKILARLFLYDCSLSLGQSWLRINKSTDIQMHTFYAIQIYNVYQRMHSRKKWLLFLQNYFSAMKLFSPGSNTQLRSLTVFREGAVSVIIPQERKVLKSNVIYFGWAHEVICGVCDAYNSLNCV